MSTDALLVSAAVIGAVVWLAARAWRRLRARGARAGCPGGCGCAGGDPAVKRGAPSRKP